MTNYRYYNYYAALYNRSSSFARSLTIKIVNKKALNFVK